MPSDTDLGSAGKDVSAFRFAENGQEYIALSVPIRVTPHLGMTAAEAAVASLILKGASNRDIAGDRGTSERTVANQVASLLRKFKVGSREQLAVALGAR